MKVTYNWLKEFVDVKLAPDALAQRLTMAGLSVAALDRAGDDWVYDIEVTSNRPDWLSVRGIAREVAAVTGAKFKKKDDGQETIDNRKKKKKKDYRPSSIDYRQDLSISIEDPGDCPLYCGTLITGVKIMPSPKEIVARLEALGVRPVNNIVDITNICMLEYGQPLHAFDFDKLARAAIAVRRARPGEKLVLIDGGEKNLTPEILVIADAARPVAVAGVMGGRDTEVGAATKNILLESAVFSPAVVRRGARALGAGTEASYRFERGVDAAVTREASDAAARMILELGGGTLAASQERGRQKQAQGKKIIFSLKEARGSLGLALPAAKAKKILADLGFGVRPRKGDVFEVTVPAARRDVLIKEDIAEELARSIGYDHIPLTAPWIKPFMYETPAIQRATTIARKLLVASGCKEVITYSLISDDDHKKSAIGETDGLLELVNPLSVEARLLRATLLPSLLRCVAFNMNQGNKDFEIFEAAHVFGVKGEGVSLGIALVGNRRYSWERESRPYTLFDLKGLIESLAETLEVSIGFAPADRGIFAPGTGMALSIHGQPCGILGQLSEPVRKNWAIKAKADIFVGEICLEAVARHARFTRKFSPVITTPCVHRDISLVAGPGVSFEKVQALIRERASSCLRAVSLADTYCGKEIPKGSLGLTVSLEYGVAGKTLTDQEVDSVHRDVLEALVKELGVTLR